MGDVDHYWVALALLAFDLYSLVGHLLAQFHHSMTTLIMYKKGKVNLKRTFIAGKSTP